jgi:hypothetical protein
MCPLLVTNTVPSDSCAEGDVRSARTCGESVPQFGDNITTIIAQGLPRSTNATKLMEELDALGFADRYDYVYLPQDKRGIKGYAFINMITSEDAERLRDCFNGIRRGARVSFLDEKCTALAARIQGRDDNLRNLWSLWNGMTPVHDGLPSVRIDGKMVEILPWDFLHEKPPESSKCVPQTLCLRGIPNQLCPLEIMEILDSNGLEGKYSYFYMPCDVRSFCNRGYAFVHLVDQEAVQLFMERMNGYSFEGLRRTQKTLRVSVAKYQGVVENLEHCQSIDYSRGLLYYPWVLIDGEMKCLATKDALQECMQDFRKRRDSDGDSTDAGSGHSETSASA